jgi:hypothetical protein
MLREAQVEKENFHQFTKSQPLHKEKEMADFRKCLLAFAVLALLSSLAVPASAQNTSAMQCTFNAAVTPTVRVEGLTELLGDIVLNCTGGTPTQPGQTVPGANITVFLSNASITSRITSSPFVETLLIVDEPHSATNPTVPLTPADPANANLGICAMLGSPTPGINTYNPAMIGNNVSCSGATSETNVTRANVYQARLTGVNQVTFFGVPIDPPGTNGTRIIRITNVRANANMAGASTGSLVPQTITAFISVNPPNLLPLNNPQQTVAFVRPGLVTSVASAQTFVQCIGQNTDIAKDSSKNATSQFNIRFDEGFASAWKERNIQVHLSNTAGGIASPAYPGDAAQDVPGANYFSEGGFLVNGVTPQGTIPPGYGPFGACIPASGAVSCVAPVLPANAAFGTIRGMNLAGYANAGTRLYLNFGAVPNGTQIFVPARVSLNTLLGSTVGVASGFAVLTSTDVNGGGGFSAATSNSYGWAPVSVTGGTGLAVYEILFTDPFNIERMTIPVAVAYVANVGNNLPQPSLQSTWTGGYAPLSSVGTASDTAPIPRFAPSQTPINTYIINKCSCNILFPFVSNQQGFDTGVAIANTTVDPWGTTPQSGIVTLKYYSLGTPPADNVSDLVAGGDELLFTLSGGGNHQIKATPGFQGYIIAVAQFQYCHAFAYISAQGALPTAAGASEGYLGIVLDSPGLNRTGQEGEVQAH